MIAIYYTLFACLILFIFNLLTNNLCIQKNIPSEKQMTVFRMINVSITILLISSYINIIFSVQL